MNKNKFYDYVIRINHDYLQMFFTLYFFGYFDKNKHEDVIYDLLNKSFISIIKCSYLINIKDYEEIKKELNNINNNMVKLITYF